MRRLSPLLACRLACLQLLLPLLLPHCLKQGRISLRCLPEISVSDTVVGCWYLSGVVEAEEAVRTVSQGKYDPTRYFVVVCPRARPRSGWKSSFPVTARLVSLDGMSNDHGS